MELNGYPSLTTFGEWIHPQNTYLTHEENADRYLVAQLKDKENVHKEKMKNLMTTTHHFK